MKLVINQVGYKVNQATVLLYYTFTPTRKGYMKTIERFAPIIARANPESFKLDEGESIGGDAKIYFSFVKDASFDKELNVDISKESTLKKFYVKEMLIEGLKAKKFIIDSHPSVGDLSVYEYIANSSFPSWSRFQVFNLLIHDRNITIALASQNTLVSNEGFKNLDIPENQVTKLIVDYEVFHRMEDDSQVENLRIVANQEIKLSRNLMNEPKRLQFKSYLNVINRFYSDALLDISCINVYTNGFRELSPDADYFSVLENTNLMKFGNNAANVNIPNGMKYNGPFKVPTEKTDNLQFLFIYNDRKHANDLYRYMKEGLKHFPGLESYVKVPFRPNTPLSLKYSNVETFRIEFDEYLNEKLPDETYYNQFAIVILPFSKLTESENEAELYFYIKRRLLEKGISSQCIDYRSIYAPDFHFHLPNIAVAILAKIGGIPWKLDTKPSNELIIGFGEKCTEDGRIIGNTVFFDNSGELKKVGTLSSENDSIKLATTLKSAIMGYLKDEQKYPERIIIHYYKALSGRERKVINDALRDLNLSLPFVVLEINDSKAKDYLCFDREYFDGMPISGTIVKLFRWNEYLLFNNSRYEVSPRSKVQDEYPIKVRFHFSEGIDLSRFECQKLLSQVYEFSRLYWKSIRQQSLPVTIKYSKLIAEYTYHFKDDTLPNNEVTQKTVWFI